MLVYIVTRNIILTPNILKYARICQIILESHGIFYTIHAYTEVCRNSPEYIVTLSFSCYRTYMLILVIPFQ